MGRDLHETERHRLGPGDCTRPRRVRCRPRPRRQVRLGNPRGDRRQVSEAISTTRSSASELSSRTGRLITGRWAPSAHLTWAKGRRCHAQTGPLTCRKKLARLPEHLVTRDFSRESCQPSTRHCELRCARDVGFEPVSAAVFWIFRFRKVTYLSCTIGPSHARLLWRR